MKLAFVIFRYFPFGGLQRDMLLLAQAALAAGHSVTIYCGAWKGEKFPGIDVNEIAVRNGLNIAGVKLFVDAFLQQFPRAEYDLLVGFNKMPGLDVYFAGDTCFAYKAFVERRWWYRLAPRSRLYLAYEAAVFGQYSETRILSLSRAEQQKFARFYATAPERFHLLPPGISAQHVACADPAAARRQLRAEFKVAPDTRVILCLGSGFHTKGVDISLEIFAALQQYRQDAILVVVGQDDPQDYIAQAQRLKIADHVFFPGAREPVGALLSAADCLLHPARLELAGNVILEAMLCACPVLASDHCGYAHYLETHGFGALIKKDAAPAQSAQVLSTLLEQPKSQWELKARQLWQDGSFFSRSAQALQIITDLVQHKPRPVQRQFRSGDTRWVLRDEFIDAWEDQPVFERVQQLTGPVARELPDRQTLRFELHGRGYYRKWHRGVGWGEIIKNWLCLRSPVLGARNEWNALNTLRALGIPSLEAVAFGERGTNPARQQSFIVTRELCNVIQLDHYFAQREPRPALKRAILARVAVIARLMHGAGINHRDFYLCHFLLREASLMSSGADPDIYLVDLHRAQMRTQVPVRWLVKDLGGLLFSSLNLGFGQRDYFRFLKTYFDTDLRVILKSHGVLLRKIIRRAHKTYTREFGHPPQNQGSVC